MVAEIVQQLCSFQISIIRISVRNGVVQSEASFRTRLSVSMLRE